jgi:SagB-type dehydrogenase family enzyme
MSSLLKSSCGVFNHSDGTVHRAQASAGARYPIEIYPIVRFSSSSDLSPGVYHYNVKDHALEYLWPDNHAGVDPKTLVQDPWALGASVMFVVTAVFWRSQKKYSARSYRYICMEAGAILQNANLYASDTDLKVVGYGGIHEDKVEQLLRLDTKVESVLCAFLVGK